MKDQYSLTYNHLNKNIPAEMADGAYCMAGINGNIFLNFFQEPPDIPKNITFYEDIRNIPDEDKIEDPLQQHQIPCWEVSEEGINRIFIDKIQMTPAVARKLAENILLAISDMEK